MRIQKIEGTHTALYAQTHSRMQSCMRSLTEHVLLHAYNKH